MKIKLTFICLMCFLMKPWLHSQSLMYDCTSSNLVLSDDYSNPALWSMQDQWSGNANGTDLNGEVSVHNGALNFTAGEWNAATGAYLFPTCSTGFNLKGAACNRDLRSYRDIGTMLSNLHWRSECKMKISSMAGKYSTPGGNAPSHMLMGMTANNSNPQGFPQNLDFTSCGAASWPGYGENINDGIYVSLIAFGAAQVPNNFGDRPFPGPGSGWRIYGHAKNDGNNWWPGPPFDPNTGTPSVLNWSAGIPLPTNPSAINTDYWIRLERISANTCRISVFSDINMTQHIPGSPQCFSIDPNIQNLHWVQHEAHPSGSQYRSLNGTIDDLKIYNNCPDYPFVASASPNPVCPNQPITLSTSDVYTGEYWYPGNLWGSPVTAIPTTTTTYNAFATMPGSGNQIAGNCVLSAQVTVTTYPVVLLNPAFSITTNYPASSSTFTINATPINGSTNNDIWNLNQQWISQFGGNNVYGYWWEVSEVDCITGTVVPGTTMTNPPNWWYNNPSTLSFPGYLADQSIYSQNIYPPAMGNFLGCHCYRITRGVWGPCQTFTTSSVQVSECRTGRMIKPVDYHPSFESVMASSKMSSSSTLESTLLIYPNPNNGSFTIQMGNVFNNSSIEVMDVLGKVVYKKENTSREEKVDISNLGSGVYYIHITNSNGLNEVRKVIKE